MYREVMEHPAFDGFWRAISTREQLDKVRVPAFTVGDTRARVPSGRSAKLGPFEREVDGNRFVTMSCDEHS